MKEDTKVNPAAHSSQSSCAKSIKHTPQTNIRHGHGTSDRKETPPECKNAVAEVKKQENFPTPKVPYPRFSSLLLKERVIRMCSLKNNKQDTVPQVHSVHSSSSCFETELGTMLKSLETFFNFILFFNQNLIEKVKMEVAEFMKYLQDVAKVCADDYNFMPVGASRYSEVQHDSSECYKFCTPLSNVSSTCLCIASYSHLSENDFLYFGFTGVF